MDKAYADKACVGFLLSIPDACKALMFYIGQFLHPYHSASSLSERLFRSKRKFLDDSSRSLLRIYSTPDF